MQSESLSHIFSELVSSEKRLRDRRIYLNSLLQEIDKSCGHLSELTDQLNDVRQQIQLKTDLLPSLITNITISHNESKIIRDQFEEFSHKKEDFTQKLACINDKIKNEIDMFVERCLKFSAQYGVRGVVYNQLIQLENHIEWLKNRKIELQSKIQDMECHIKYFESIETERKSIKESISYLESKKAKLESENIQLKRYATQLKAEMKTLENLPNNGPQFLKLKHQLESANSSEICSAREQFQTNIELENNFKIKHQSVETPSQPVFPTEKNFEINEKSIGNNVIEIRAEENNKSSEEQKNPNQKYWEKYAKRRRLITKESCKE